MNTGKRIKIGIYGPIYQTNLLVNQINNIDDKFYAENIIENRFSHNCDIYHGLYGFLSKRFVFTKLFGKKNICHWIGTDVLEIINNKSFQKIRYFLSKFIDVDIAVTENLINELKGVGIKSKLMPIVSNLDNIKIAPFSKKFTVLTYIPQNRLEFFNFEIILALIKKNPNIQFLILANSGEGLPKYDNLKYIKWCEDASKYYYHTTVVLRIPKHDGLSLTVIEALASGRYVIWNYPFPYCHYSPPDVDNIQSVLEEIRKNPVMNYEGSNYVKKNYSISRIVKNDLFNLYNEVLDNCSTL